MEEPTPRAQAALTNRNTTVGIINTIKPLGSDTVWVTFSQIVLDIVKMSLPLTH